MEGTLYWPTVFFWLFSAIACGFAIAVVLTANIVRMAFYLVISLAATAALFFLAGADFVGAMQLLIYVGGTLVLLIFGVMLTSQERFVSIKTGREEMWIAGLVGACLLSMLVWAAVSVPEWKGIDRAAAEAVPLEPTAAPIGMGLLGARVDAPNLESSGHSGYLLVFEIISVHLLVVLLGAAYFGPGTAKTQHGADHMNTLMFANMLDLTQPVGVSQYLIVGAVLFVCGALCMATKRNALGILMGIELVLNGANLNFIAFGSPYLRNDANSLGLDGQLMSLFVIVLAAAEAAVALAIALNFYNSFSTIDVDRADQLQG